ncbi:MAG: HIT family protein [Phreatobacter sp.]|uniref:HIT domain-containing protein n=1 Tax=Phreatobacter sp. TaxID=1966341 RepID=UPI002733209C|nr:HIT family protein [Phreatobacter sp.]MDP2803520.1 HIT family protein [Phreatobacter sp.]
MTTDFSLDPRLAADTLAVADLPLSAVRLMNDATYPWLILVPRREGAVEIVDLEPQDRVQLMEEIATVSGVLRAMTVCDKLNVAALGNMVPQLHVHVIGRFAGDPAWPGPVWGKVPAKPYADAPREGFITALRARLSAG